MAEPEPKLDKTNSAAEPDAKPDAQLSATQKFLQETRGATAVEVQEEGPEGGLPLTGPSLGARELAQPERSSKPRNPFQFNEHDYHPVVTALTARMGINGIRGHLLLDKSTAVGMLNEAGPLGRQLAERVGIMEAQGWSVGRLRVTDPYLKEAFPNPLKRAAIFPAIAGYNSLYHNQTLYKRITYNSWSHLVNQSLSSYGLASPATRVVGNLAHELGHWDRIPLPETTQLKELTLAEKRVVAMRLLQAETNAILPQLHISEKLRAYHPDIEIYREALKKGQLGSVLRNRWSGFGQIYETLKHVTPVEADALVREHLETNYKGVVKPNGQIAAYDLNSVRGKYFGTTSLDRSILAKMDNPAQGVHIRENRLVSSLSEGRTGTVLRRGGQALAGVGVALIGTDIAAGFYESAEKGFGKVGRTAVTLGAFELGSAGGAAIGAPLARMAMKTRYGYMALPLATLLSGITLSSTVDLMYGGKIERAIQDSLSSKPEDELRKTLLGR